MQIVIIILAIFAFIAGICFGIRSNRCREQLPYIPEPNPDYEALNHLMHLVYQNNLEKGFRAENDEPKVGDHIANLHSEISELWKSYTNRTLDTPCDKSEKMNELFGEILTSKEEEIADVIIRALDTAHSLGITNIGRAVKIKMVYNKTREYRHGNKLA